MDPLLKSSSRTDDAPLFGTRHAAAAVAARNVPRRYAQIMDVLRQRGPSAIFQIAAVLGVLDHQIAGRFGEMEKAGLIRRSGRSVVKPATGCACELYELVTAHEPPSPTSGAALAQAIGYPTEIRLEDGIYHLAAPDSTDSAPGHEYLRFTEGDRPRMSIRVAMILCPACGSPLSAGPDKVCRCPGPCPGAKGWRPKLLHIPGHPDLLAILLEST